MAASSRFAVRCATRWPGRRPTRASSTSAPSPPGSTQHLAAKLFETVAGGRRDWWCRTRGQPGGADGAARRRNRPGFRRCVGPMVAAGAGRCGEGAGSVFRPAATRRLPDVPTAAAGRRGRLQRRELECHRRACRHAARGDRQAQPRGTRGGGIRRTCRPSSGQGRHAPGRPVRRRSCRRCWAAEIKRWGEVIRAARIEPE